MSVQKPQFANPPLAPPRAPSAGKENAPADFAYRVHGSSDPSTTAVVIVNELKRWCGCDRVSLVRYKGREARLLATSGLDAVEPRASAVRALESLALDICQSREISARADGAAPADPAEDSLITEGSTTEALTTEALARYRALSPAVEIGVFPLCERGALADKPASGTRALADKPASGTRCVGCLVVEGFQAGADYRGSASLDELLPHAELAFVNAVRSASRPLARVSSLLESLPKAVQVWRFPKRALVLLAVFLAGLILVLVPAEFTIKARGQLVPRNLRHVFAGVDGVVDEIRVEQGAQVAAGQVLLVLRSSSLEYESSRVLGELQTARSRLESIRTSLIRDLRGTTRENDADRLALEEKELQELISSLEAQQALLTKQREQLQIRAPLAGRITTWDAERLLATRPVKRGQRLVTVADLDGPWMLEIPLPDHHIGHVTRAAKELAGPPAISFVLPSDAGHVRQAELEETSATVEFDETGAPVVPVTALVTGESGEFKPGVTAIARVHCGRRALGYVWFHDLIDTLRAWLWL